MKAQIFTSLFAVLLLLGGECFSADIQFRYKSVTGIGQQAGVCRRDPSDVIKVGDQYYVWYSRVTKDQKLYPTGYRATVWYAVSDDGGYKWVEKGEALGKGSAGSFDSTGVFTPNILPWNGKYYLYYTGVGDEFPDTYKEHVNNGGTVLAVAVADSPDGPWQKITEPILKPTGIAGKKFDDFRVDDASLRVVDGKVWLYYKGRKLDKWKDTGDWTKMGIAVADQPEGLYQRLNNGVHVQDSGHEVLVWEQDGGVYSMVTWSGPRNFTLRFAADGVDFDSRVIAKFKKDTPGAPGLYRPELTGDPVESRQRWGIAARNHKAGPFLIRYEFSLPPLK